jgi:diguanylate cyclase (GGDEF)-like protein
MASRFFPDVLGGNILIVDDVRSERLIIGRLLTQLGYQSQAVENGWEALQKLQESHFDLMLLDLSMPEVDGLEVLRQLRGNSPDLPIPVIVMSSARGSDLAARCLELGAEDFLPKPVDAHLLKVRLRSTLERERLRQIQSHQLEQLQVLRENLEASNRDLKAANLSLQQLAFSDGLTGLPNRRSAMETLQQMWALQLRSSRPFSLMMADIDHFKSVNDQYGHSTGDHVLKGVASALQRLLRAGDVVARIGGEEFLILCPDTDLAGAKVLGERLRSGIENQSFAQGNFQRPVTISLGVAQSSEQTPTPQSLMEAADQALYQAKGLGRNRVALAEIKSSVATPAARSWDYPVEASLSEPGRQAILEETQLLDSEPESIFDRFTSLASRLLKAPVSLVSLVTADRQFFKSQVGLAETWAKLRQTPISHSFCRIVVDSGKPLKVNRARTQFPNHPAIEDLGVESYLGVPLQVDGANLGSFCVIDSSPREWTADEQLVLADLAAAVAAEIELRLSLTRQQALGLAYRQAKEGAEAANRAKSDFLASASHELRTPLNGIIGMCELLKGTPLNAEQREYIHLLRLSADSLLELVNDVLDLAKIESGHFELRPAPVEIREAMAMWLKPLAIRAAQEGLQMSLQVDRQVPPMVTVDPVRLRQILVNLVGNALKFTSKGSVLIKVHQIDTESLEFVVADTGSGIPKDKLNSIFEAFSQVESSVSNQGVGTGLGLSIVQRLVGYMGGEIRCQSELQQGSQFTFVIRSSGQTPLSDSPTSPTLALVSLEADQKLALEQLLEHLHLGPAPLDLAKATVVEVGRQEALALSQLRQLEQSGRPMPKILIGPPGWEPSPAWQAQPILGRICWPVAPSELKALLEKPVPEVALTTPDSQRHLSVLVLEDNRVNQKVIRAMLERLGHQVEVTDSGNFALRRLLEGIHFDLALVDIEMPEMSGLEFARRSRALPQPPKMPLVALTARALTEDREECLQAGMQAYLSKPITLTALNQILESLGLCTSRS